MKNFLIAPSILFADFARLGEDITKVISAGADIVHFDVMDNHYVPNFTVGPMVLKSLCNYGITVPIDVHLMVKPVDCLIPDFAAAGASYITFHPEASEHVDRSLQLIRAHGCKAGLALNPATPLNYLDHVLDKIDIILLMSVNPGFGGQLFLTSTFDKLRQVRRLIDLSDRDIKLEVDGGVNIDNIGSIAAAGADIFVAGSAIFNQPNYRIIIDAMRSKLRKYKKKLEINSIRGIAFNFDDIFINNILNLADALDCALSEKGLPQAGLERISTWIGNGDDVLIERALRWAIHKEPDENLKNAIHLRLNELYSRVVKVNNNMLLTEVIDTLVYLTYYKLSMVVITNKLTSIITSLLTSLGIAHHFQMIIGNDTTSVQKPHPASLYLILGHLGLYSRELLLVSNSKNDILMAKTAGCPYVSIGYKYNYSQNSQIINLNVSNNLPDYEFDHFTDLLSMLGLSHPLNQED